MWKAPVMCALLIWHEYPMRAAIRGNCLWCKCCFNSFKTVNYSFTYQWQSSEETGDGLPAVAYSLWVLFTAVKLHSTKNLGTAQEDRLWKECERTGKVCVQIMLPSFSFFLVPHLFLLLFLFQLLFAFSFFFSSFSFSSSSFPISLLYPCSKAYNSQ